MHKCPWCTTVYVNWQSQCGQCGGPLPPPPGMDIGPPPPAAPRKLLPRYVRRVRITSNIAVMVGAGFFMFGLLMFIPMVVNRLWAAVLPGFFMLGGGSMFRYGWRQASGVLNAFRYGRAVEGKVHRVSWDTSTTVNGEHPWKLVYVFTADNQRYEGSVTTFDATAGERSSGQPLWVLYNEADPTQSAIYPPLA